MKSMTGFGQGSGEAAGYVFHASIKTVNHKYLDPKISLPFGLGALEPKCQAVVRRRLSRGRVEVSITVAAGSPPVVRPRVDASLAAAYVTAFHHLGEELHLEGRITVNDLLRLHETLLITDPVADLDALAPGMEAAVEQAVRSVERMRQEEGAALTRDLLERVGVMESLCGRLDAMAPEALRALVERLEQRTAELLRSVAVDPQRLAQECAFLAERTDVAEELTRLRSHLGQFKKMVASSEPVGRKLDFLCQELNREANTLTSKASNADMATLVVDLKAEIERVREQVQNVE